MRGIHRWPVDSPRKGPVTRKCFHLMTSCILYAFHHMNLIRSMGAGRHFKVDTLFLRYRESHYRDKTAPSYLYNGNPYTVKMVSLYWDAPLVSTYCTLCCQVRYWPCHWYWLYVFLARASLACIISVSWDDIKRIWESTAAISGAPSP